MSYCVRVIQRIDEFYKSQTSIPMKDREPIPLEIAEDIATVTNFLSCVCIPNTEMMRGFNSVWVDLYDYAENLKLEKGEEE